MTPRTCLRSVGRLLFSSKQRMAQVHPDPDPVGEMRSPRSRSDSIVRTRQLWCYDTNRRTRLLAAGTDPIIVAIPSITRRSNGRRSLNRPVQITIPAANSIFRRTNTQVVPRTDANGRAAVASMISRESLTCSENPRTSLPIIVVIASSDCPNSKSPSTSTSASATISPRSICRSKVANSSAGSRKKRRSGGYSTLNRRRRNCFDFPGHRTRNRSSYHHLTPTCAVPCARRTVHPRRRFRSPRSSSRGLLRCS